MNETAGRIRIPKSKVRQAMRAQLEKEYPGYLETDDKLHVMVKTLTGLRILYSLFYLSMTLLYGMQGSQAFMNLISPVFFYLWYVWMLRSGKMAAVLMLFFRGVSIVYGGVSVLEMSGWIPYPLLFMVVLALMLEFIESVFCIDTLFQAEHAQAVRLNRMLEQMLRAGVLPSSVLEELAAYQNPDREES